MNIDPIITSMLDDDLYKVNMGSVVFHLFPRAIVTYEFFNRGKTEFPKGFAEELREQVIEMQTVQLTADEAENLKTVKYIRPTYIEWLRGYQMDPSEVTIKQEGGKLSVKIRGPWYRTIYWEVKLMALISELYFIMTGQTMDAEWQQRIIDKAKALSEAGCYWIDFGSRRRFSYKVQDMVVQIMRQYKGFLGTSNPHFAHKYGVTPHGTYAHESIMAMSALYGVRMADKMWRKHWADHFDGNVGVALTDTFTTAVFDRDFGTYDARLFDGCRQDSGDPKTWGHNRLAHYKMLGIPATNKRFVFSNNLNVPEYISIHNEFQGLAQPVAGIGTNFTNDVGVKPLNMVIKLTSADFGNGPVNVVKLSDDAGKHTGDTLAIDLAKRELGLV